MPTTADYDAEGMMDEPRKVGSDPTEEQVERAIQEAADYIQHLEDEYRTAKDALERAHKAALAEDTRALYGLSHRTARILTEVSGWGREVV